MATGPGYGQGAAAVGEIPRELTLLIRESPENLLKIEQIIRSLDLPPKQVLIEAHIFDVSLNDDNSMGIDWSALMTQMGRTEPVFQVENMLGLPAGNGALKFGTLNNEHFTLLLRVLKNNRRARSLSNPKVTAVDGTKATIRVEQEIPYQEAETTFNGAGQSQTSYKTKFKNAPIKLEVTPTIFDDGTMRLRLQPEVTSVVSLVPNQAPWTEKRTAETDVVVRTGETLILGGLITENKSSEIQTMPLLNRVPVLKRAFERKTRNNRRSELVVFITPNLITSADSTAVLQASARRSAERQARTDPNALPELQ